MMIEHEKTDALLAVAKAFYDRGPCVQYDQLSMDRLLRVTPRRRRMAAPEDATRQSTLFLIAPPLCGRYITMPLAMRLKRISAGK